MKEWINRIDRQLEQLLPNIIDPNWIESVLDQPLNIEDYSLFETIVEPAKDLVFRGGKRWRPLLLLLNALILGSDEAFEKALLLTPLVELPHNGSLIIDDIEDNSPLRRGELAVHTRYGVDISINAGNLLYYLPTLLLDKCELDVEVKFHIFQIYSTYMRRIHFGQGMDISWHNTPTFPPIESYELMCKMKTGCLAAMGAKIGAAIATKDLSVIEKAGAIGEEIGLYFQILDDCINLETGNPGKRRGDDIIENKKSLPLLLYAQKGEKERERLLSLFETVKNQEYEKHRDLIESFIEEVAATGAIASARISAIKLLYQIKTEIEKLYPPSLERDKFISLVETF